MPVSLEQRLAALVERLAGGDRRAGDELLRIGVPAVPPLVRGLTGGEPELRKAAAFLLGRLGGRERLEEARRREVAAALAAALGDEEPKVRKNAAVALGRVAGGQGGSGGAVAALAAALERETVAWVRPSLVLALGGAGGDPARAALADLEPASPAEAEALRKAEDRLRPEPPRVAWRESAELPGPWWAAVPVGLEDVSRGEVAEVFGAGGDGAARVGAGGSGGEGTAVGGTGAAARRPAVDRERERGAGTAKGDERPEAERASAVARGIGAGEPPGRLPLPEGVAPAEALARLRTIHDVRLLLAEGPSLDDVGHGELPARVASLLAASPALAGWRSWLRSEDAGGAAAGASGAAGRAAAGELTYRFALDELRLPKAVFFAVLGAVREALLPLGLRDSPSAYALQLTVEAGATRAWLLPSFAADDRFAYRRQDVGAAIHPVVAACLVRLLRGERGGGGPRRVLDPTCGSGTLLVERARLGGGELELRGLDASPTAVRAAQANVAAAGLAGRVRIERADATDPRSWRPVDEVVANLPFGRRSRRRDPDLEHLYRRLAEHLARFLEPGGRAVLYTSDAALLDAALAAAGVGRPGGPALRERRSVESGGLRVGVWVLENGDL
jgi:SAM-dependent methyltransferase